MDGTALGGRRQQTACTEDRQQARQPQPRQPQQRRGEASGQKRRHSLPAPLQEQQPAGRHKSSMQSSSAPAHEQRSGWMCSPFDAAAPRHQGRSGAAAQPGTSPHSLFAAQHTAQGKGCGALPPPGRQPSHASLRSQESPPLLPLATPAAELAVHQAFMAPGWPLRQWAAGGGGAAAAQRQCFPDPPPQESRATPLRSSGCPTLPQQGAHKLDGVDRLPPPQEPSSAGPGQWQVWTTEEADDQVHQLLDMARELGLLPECSSGSGGQCQPSWVPCLACEEPSTPPSRCQMEHSARQGLELSDTAHSGGAERGSHAPELAGQSAVRQRHPWQQQQQQPQRQQHAALPPPGTVPVLGLPCGMAAWPPGVIMPKDMPQLWRPLPPPPRLNFPTLIPAAEEGCGAAEQPATLVPAGVQGPPVPQRVRAAPPPQGQQAAVQQQPTPQQQRQMHSKQQQQQAKPQQKKRKRPAPPPPPPPQQQQQDADTARPPKSRRRADQPAQQLRQEGTAVLSLCQEREAEAMGAALLAELRRHLLAQQQAEAEAWRLEQRRWLDAAQAEQRRLLEATQARQRAQLELAVDPLLAMAAMSPARLLGRRMSQPQPLSQQPCLPLSDQLALPQPQQLAGGSLPLAERRRSAEAEAFLRSMSLKQGRV